MPFEICAGSDRDIRKDSDSGQWMIVDMGFAAERRDGHKGRTCAVWTADGGVVETTFGCLQQLVIREAQKKGLPRLNLLIEAPLSVAFDANRNPTGRSCDTQDDEHRYWYVASGIAMIAATSYLLRALHDCRGRRREVRLFEGFVSFKPPKLKTKCFKDFNRSHSLDVLKLKSAVWNPTTARVFSQDEIERETEGCVESAFAVAKMDFGIPPVIRPYANACQGPKA